MSGIPVGDVGRGVAAAALAILPAYLSIEGLLTGDTLALARNAYSHAGAAGIVTATGYGLFAAALALAAARYFSANAKRRAALFRGAMNVAIVAAVVFFSGRLVHVVQ